VHACMHVDLQWADDEAVCGQVWLTDLQARPHG
jgi:hypothetical protein